MRQLSGLGCNDRNWEVVSITKLLAVNYFDLMRLDIVLSAKDGLTDNAIGVAVFFSHNCLHIFGHLSSGPSDSSLIVL